MTATLEQPIIIDKPGVYDGIPEDKYHADPIPAGSLSYSGAKRLLDCPAKYDHERRNGRKSKDVFDFGHTFHTLVLGTGAQIEVIDSPDYKTAEAKAIRDAARAEGAAPVLRKDYVKAQNMAAAVRAHPLANALFDHDRGQPERSMFWVDPETKVWCRSRTDYMTTLRTGQLAVVDLKSCDSAKPANLRRTIRTYYYELQDWFYRCGAEALNLGDDPDFAFVFVEKEPPHVVTVCRLDEEARQLGQQLHRRALNRYVECTASGRWPGYVDDTTIVEISEPTWVAFADIEDL